MAERKGSGCMIIVATGAVLAGIVMVWPSNNGPSPRPTQPVEVTQPAVPEKPGVMYYIIESGQSVPPSIKDHTGSPSVELHVANVPTEAECQRMGGKYQAHNKICLDVDF